MNPSHRKFWVSGRTNVERWRTGVSNSWETIRGRSVQKRELPFSLDTMSLSPDSKIHLFCIGLASVSVCLVSTVFVFVMLETRCHLGASFIKSAACACKPEQWIKLKEACVCLSVPSCWCVGGFVCFPRGKQMNPRHDLLWFPLRRMLGSSSSTSSLRPPSSLHRYVYICSMAAKFVSKLVFSQDDLANSERLEPAFESLLRSLKVKDVH